MSPFLLFSAIGVVALGIGAWKTVEANPHRRIPLICPPRDRPLPIILLQAVGYGSSIFAVLMLSDQWGAYAYLLFIVMVLPEVVLFSIHNHQLKHGGLSQG